MANQVTATANLTDASASVIVPGVDLTGQGLAAGNGLYVIGEQARYQLAGVPTFDGTDTTLTLTGNYAGATASGVAIVVQTSYTTLGLPRLPVVARNAGAIMAYLADKLDSLVQSIINGTLALTAPDINGGTADDITSLSVAADSDGNVSRWVMKTANVGVNIGYWAKLATITPTATNYTDATIRLSVTIGDVTNKGGSVDLDVAVGQGLVGFADVYSQIAILSNTNKLPPLVFKLVGDGGTNGLPVELWVQNNDSYGYLSVAEISNKSGVGSASVTYNNNAAWQSAAPTGVVEITSDWAGSGQLTSTSFLNGWAGTAYYEKTADGWVSISGHLTTVGTTTDGTTIFTIPAGYRPSVRESSHIKASGSVSGGSACAIELLEDTGAISISGTYIAGGTFLRFSAQYRSRN